MVNKTSHRLTVATFGYLSTGALPIVPLRLRDPDETQQEQPFCENFLSMAGLYSRYRVNGVKLYIHVVGTTSNENDKFWIMAYTTSTADGNNDPYTTTTIPARGPRDGLLQDATTRRKKLIAGSGTVNVANHFWRVGYFSIATMEKIKREELDDDEYSGTVTTTGAAVVDPIKRPRIRIRLVSPNYNGFPDVESVDVNITAVYDVEWFNKRRAIEPSIVETDT